MNLVEQTLVNDYGIDFELVKLNLIPKINTLLFKTRMLTRIFSINIPDNTEHDYFLITFPRAIKIHNIKNAQFERIYKKKITYAVNLNMPYTVVNELTDTDTHIMAQHGNDWIIETQDEPRTIQLECLVTDKTSDNLDIDIYDNILYLYYNTYLINGEYTINYLQKLSLAKQNVLAQRNVNNWVFKPNYGKVKAYKL